LSNAQKRLKLKAQSQKQNGTEALASANILFT
jgi:hypothetical protein